MANTNRIAALDARRLKSPPPHKRPSLMESLVPSMDFPRTWMGGVRV